MKECPHENLDSLRMTRNTAVSHARERVKLHSQRRAPRIIAGYVEPGSESLNAVKPPWFAVIDGIRSDEERHCNPPGAKVSIHLKSVQRRKK